MFHNIWGIVTPHHAIMSLVNNTTFISSRWSVTSRFPFCAVKILTCWRHSLVIKADNPMGKLPWRQAIALTSIGLAFIPNLHWTQHLQAFQYLLRVTLEVALFALFWYVGSERTPKGQRKALSDPAKRWCEANRKLWEIYWIIGASWSIICVGFYWIYWWS